MISCQHFVDSHMLEAGATQMIHVRLIWPTGFCSELDSYRLRNIIIAVYTTLIWRLKIINMVSIHDHRKKNKWRGYTILWFQCLYNFSGQYIIYIYIDWKVWVLEWWDCTEKGSVEKKVVTKVARVRIFHIFVEISSLG